MVQFTQLLIDPDSDTLNVKCQIENLAIYKDVYIESITAKYYDGTAVMTMYSKGDDEEGLQVVSVSKGTDEIPDNFGTTTFIGGLFYITVVCGGTPSGTVSTLPCNYDTMTAEAIVIDWHKLYEMGMQFVVAMASNCKDRCSGNEAFEHFILLWNALKLAVETCDHTMIESLWKKFLRICGNSTVMTITSNCGCTKI